MNNIIITLDIDWAPDFVIDTVAEKLIKRITWRKLHLGIDGAYDSFDCYKQILEKEAVPVIPPRKDAIERIESDDFPEISARNQVVRKISEQGSTIWKQENNYFRIKTLFGNQLKAQLFESQEVESFVRCLILNRMTALGLPEYSPIG